jgi:dihydroxyacetone kinase phosphoprotein-dependent L subunit
MRDALAIPAVEFRSALLHVCDAIQLQEPYLNRLDSAIGDGDHGITMRLGFSAVRKRLLEMPDEVAVGTLLVEAGKAFMRSTGGAIGVILGQALVSAGVTTGGTTELGLGELRSIFGAMEKAVAEKGKARPGDKTLLDPLHALNDALSTLPEGTAAADALVAAATAAEQGAKDTAAMSCRIGRASKLGERSLGHPDPGAVSFSLIVRALSESPSQSPQLQAQSLIRPRS